MPALPNANNCYRLRLLHTIGSDTNTGWHIFIRADKPVNPTQAASLGAVASASWATNIAPVTATDTSLTSVLVTDLSDPSGANVSTGAAHAGTRVGGFLPASSCALLNFSLARRYRGGKPRAYLPAGCQPDLGNAQTWTTAFTNAVLAAFRAFRTDVYNSTKSWSATAEQVNISYYHQVLVGPPPTPPVYVEQVRPTPVIDVITGESVSSTVGSQRRRLRPGA